MTDPADPIPGSRLKARSVFSGFEILRQGSESCSILAGRDLVYVYERVFKAFSGDEFLEGVVDC